MEYKIARVILLENAQKSRMKQAKLNIASQWTQSESQDSCRRCLNIIVSYVQQPLRLNDLFSTFLAIVL